MHLSVYLSIYLSVYLSIFLIYPIYSIYPSLSYPTLSYLIFPSIRPSYRIYFSLINLIYLAYLIYSILKISYSIFCLIYLIYLFYLHDDSFVSSSCQRTDNRARKTNVFENVQLRY